MLLSISFGSVYATTNDGRKAQIENIIIVIDSKLLPPIKVDSVGSILKVFLPISNSMRKQKVTIQCIVFKILPHIKPNLNWFILSFVCAQIFCVNIH